MRVVTVTIEVDLDLEAEDPTEGFEVDVNIALQPGIPEEHGYRAAKIGVAAVAAQMEATDVADIESVQH